MEYKDLIKVRRSCRSYIDTQISNEDINTIITEALQAPSWKHSQTARFYVANTNESKEKVFNALPDFNQNSSKNASYIICTFKKGISGNGDDNWGSYDLGLSNAYLILAASNLGYDTLIMGLRDENMLRQYFNIPEDEIMLPVIALGKRNGDLVIKKRKELSEVLSIK